MFAKIDKKILLIIAVVLVVVLVAGYFVYKYSREVKTTTENTESGAIIETPGEQIITPGIEIQPQPGLTVCVDKCGDGICQPAGTICYDSLNCICAETKTDCPNDCE